jgi:hypothetical protein
VEAQTTASSSAANPIRIFIHPSAGAEIVAIQQPDQLDGSGFSNSCGVA